MDHWVHLAAVCNGNTVSFFVDGVLVSSTTRSAPFVNQRWQTAQPRPAPAEAPAVKLGRPTPLPPEAAPAVWPPMNASKSVLMVLASVVGIPWGKPL